CGARSRERLRSAALLRRGLRAGPALPGARARDALARRALVAALERPAPELRGAGAPLAHRAVLRPGAGAEALPRAPGFRATGAPPGVVPGGARGVDPG